MMIQTLNEVFPDWKTGQGIFSALQSLNVPWKNENIATTLDMEFYGNVAGSRVISPLLRRWKAGETLTPAEISALASVVYNMNRVTWEKEYATLSAQYNPIENYRMTEVTDEDRDTTYGRTDTRTDNLSHMKTGTETLTLNTSEERTDNLEHTKTGTETLTLDTSEERTDDLEHSKTGTETTVVDGSEVTTPAVSSATSVFGFNSSTAVPTGTQTQTGTNTVETDRTDTLTHNTTETDSGTQTTERTGTETTAHNVTETDSGTQTTDRTGTEATQYNTTDADTGTQTVRASGVDSESRSATLTRSGNIGVTTSQQMLESERNLWLWNYFYDCVFPSIIKTLALPIY